MLSYTEFNKTSPRVNNNVVLRETIKNWITPYFKVGDCFVTLTFKPTIQYNEQKRSKDLTMFLTRLNREIYGKAFDKGFKKLRSCPIFEVNNNEVVHVHMLLERPLISSRFTGDFNQLIVDTWYGMKNAGIKKAQDVRTCFDIDGVVNYMMKQIRTGSNFSTGYSQLKGDFNNFNLH